MRTIAKDIESKILVDGVEREYILHIPEKIIQNKQPLVICLHGGGGNNKQMKRFVNFDELSDKEGFFVVYPNGQDKQWRDGRTIEGVNFIYDDVKFISCLIDSLASKYQIDTSRIFSTGISNGGFMSFALAYKLNEKILAIAPVCANISEAIKDEFKLDKPVSLLLINGTDDPLVKYDGGAVGFGDMGNRGESISTDETIRMWKNFLSCTGEVFENKMPNKNILDGCKAIRTDYLCSSGNSPIKSGQAMISLIKIDGGGHTWPGGKQYLPKAIIGKVCKDFDAAEIIWEFFKNIPSRN